MFLTIVIFTLFSLNTAFALTSLQTISKIEVSPKEITPETDVTVTLTSTATNVDHIDLFFSTENGNADFFVKLLPTSIKSQYSGSGKIRKDIILGTWQLNIINFYYKNNPKPELISFGQLEPSGKAIKFGSTSKFYQDNKDIIDLPQKTDLTDPTPTPPPAVNPPATDKPATNGSLSDIKGHWALGSIQKLINKNYIKGYPDGYFLPNKSITRAEFIKILINALNYKSTTNTSAFKDVPSTHWAKAEIAAAKELKITEGYKDGSFKPNSNITRAEIVSMLSNAKHFTQKSTNIKFLDVKKGHWAEPAIYTAAANGVVSGYKGNLFKPNSDATRAEACSMIDSFLTLFKLY